MPRPKGPKKVDLTITLTKPVSDWLDALLKDGKIATKSFFIEQLLRERMENER